MPTPDEAMERCRVARFAVDAAERALKIARLEQQVANAWLVALLTDGTLSDYAVRAQRQLDALKEQEITRPARPGQAEET